MSIVDHERLSWIVDELDRIGPSDIPASAAKIHRRSQRYKLVASQTGFLHLGREMLRAAATDASAAGRDLNTPIVQAEIRHVFAPDSPVAIHDLERHDALPHPAPEAVSSRTWRLFTLSFVWSLAPALFFIMGGITMSNWAVDTFVIGNYPASLPPIAMPAPVIAEEAPAA